MTKPTIAAGAYRQLALLAVAMVLGMTPWFSATVAAPGMIEEWHTTPGVSAWLTITVQLGFVCGTLVSALLLLSDRFSAKRLAAGSSIFVTVATATLAWRHTGPSGAMPAYALRLVSPLPGSIHRGLKSPRAGGSLSAVPRLACWLVH